MNYMSKDNADAVLGAFANAIKGAGGSSMTTYALQNLSNNSKFKVGAVISIDSMVVMSGSGNSAIGSTKVVSGVDTGDSYSGVAPGKIFISDASVIVTAVYSDNDRYKGRFSGTVIATDSSNNKLFVGEVTFPVLGWTSTGQTRPVDGCILFGASNSPTLGTTAAWKASRLYLPTDANLDFKRYGVKLNTWE